MCRLLQYLSAGEHMDLAAMMDTWTVQKGIPLVTVRRKGPRLLLRQDRFLSPAAAAGAHMHLCNIVDSCTKTARCSSTLCLFLQRHTLINLKHRCQTQGPRAKSGPPHHFMWPLMA